MPFKPYPRKAGARCTYVNTPVAIRRLHRTAETGESPETPVILVAEVLVFLIPIAIVVLAITLGLYFSFGGS